VTKSVLTVIDPRIFRFKKLDNVDDCRDAQGRRIKRRREAETLQRYKEEEPMRALQDVGEKYVKKAAREALKRAKEESVDEREERLRLVREKREVEKRVEAAVEVAKSATQDGGVRPAKRFLDESDDESDDERDE
jgi:hypothetical protein